jgi:protein associated with RNAse G/E
MVDDVLVLYRKYDGSLHWHMTMKWLAEDDYGVWTGAFAGSTSRRGNEPPIVIRQQYVMLFPRDAWWTATFNGEPARSEIYCDIATPATWTNPREVTMIDLDLDVCRRRDGTVDLLDADEFAEHQVRYGYPAGVIEASVAAADWLRVALGDGTEPFARVYRSYLARMDEEPR